MKGSTRLRLSLPRGSAANGTGLEWLAVAAEKEDPVKEILWRGDMAKSITLAIMPCRHTLS